MVRGPKQNPRNPLGMLAYIIATTRPGEPQAWLEIPVGNRVASCRETGEEKKVSEGQARCYGEISHMAPCAGGWRLLV